MKNHIRRLIAFMILTALCLSAASGYAADIVLYASTLISTNTVTCTAGSSGKITATATITTGSKADKLGFPVIRIQEQNGTKWTNVSSASSKYETSAGTYRYSFSYTGTKGKTYRAYAEFYAAKGSNNESKSKTSGTVTAK